MTYTLYAVCGMHYLTLTKYKDTANEQFPVLCMWFYDIRSDVADRSIICTIASGAINNRCRIKKKKKK